MVTILSSPGQSDFEKKWIQVHKSERENFLYLIELLRRSPTGDKIIRAAKKKATSEGKDLLEILSSGPVSITDTTLVRKFSPANPLEVFFEQRSEVRINQNLSVIDATLDLAHELIHFVFRQPFNPYEDKRTVYEFMMATIEGKGGEVDAFVSECRVLKELIGEQGGISPRFHCQHIQDSEGAVSRDLAIQRFYQTGELEFQQLVGELGPDLQKGLPYLSKNEAIFISSAYGNSYPLAAVKEFWSVKERVCENEKRRMEYVSKVTSKEKRSPASVEVKALEHFTQSCSNREIQSYPKTSMREVF